jgi:hypothetical protein
VKLQEQEFFASRSEEIASAANAAARKKLIAKLPDESPQLWTEWCAASRRAEGDGHFIRQSGRFPLCGRGDINTYAIFAELDRELMGPCGRCGIVVPTGIATDDTTKLYFDELVQRGEIRSLYDFQTGAETFGNLAHGAMRFCLLSIARVHSHDGVVDLVFLAKSVSDLQERERHSFLSRSDFALLNPNTRTCPTFRSRRDADINLAMYRRAGILWREADEANGNPWGLRFMAMLHMANDSDLFRTRAELEVNGGKLEGNRFVGTPEVHVPLIEAKMVDQFDHRYASLLGVEAGAERTSRKLTGWYSAIGTDPNEVVQPQYWVAEREVSERLGRSRQGWLLGWRRICRSTDQRTFIASLFPSAGVGDSEFLFLSDAEECALACFYGCVCSLPLDYAARQKIGGTNASFHIVRQLPILSPAIYAANTPWLQGTVLRDFLLPRVLELTYTAWDLEPFARDVGCNGPPFRWNTERRFLLRCELDAAFFHLYGLARDDADYVIDTFPIVRKNDERAHGEYRTKRVILEIYDAMAEAARTGMPYQTRLAPPPADPCVAHHAEPRASELASAK